MSDLSYYVFALMFSTVFHELGHALAAIRYLIYFILLIIIHFCASINLLKTD